MECAGGEIRFWLILFGYPAYSHIYMFRFYGRILALLYGIQWY